MNKMKSKQFTKWLVGFLIDINKDLVYFILS